MSDTENTTVSPKSTKKSATPVAEPETPPEVVPDPEEVLYTAISTYAGSAKPVGVFSLDALLDRYPGLTAIDSGEYVDRDPNGNGLTAYPCEPIR